MIADEGYYAFLRHHGVKGMHWGVRKERDSGSEPKEPKDHSVRNHRLKVAGVVLGSVAGAALIAGGTYYLAKHGDLPISSFKEHEAAGKKIAQAAIKHEEEPTGVVHLARGKNLGFGPLNTGGLHDFLPEALKSGVVNEHGGSDIELGSIRKYGSRGEKIALRFLDPEGRTDFAGRPIEHSVILSENHARGVTNFDEAFKKAWPLVKDQYQKFWDFSTAERPDRAEAKRLGIVPA